MDPRLIGRARPLAFHGMLLFVLGLLMGIVVQSVANPRIGLSAHTGALLNGVFLVALAAVWRWVMLAPGTLLATYWLAVLVASALVVFGLRGRAPHVP